MDANHRPERRRAAVERDGAATDPPYVRRSLRTRRGRASPPHRGRAGRRAVHRRRAVREAAAAPDGAGVRDRAGRRRPRRDADRPLPDRRPPARACACGSTCSRGRRPPGGDAAPRPAADQPRPHRDLAPEPRSPAATPPACAPPRRSARTRRARRPASPLEIAGRRRAATACSPSRARTASAATAARFGAAREGHSHQGQDIVAAAGTPIVAPRAGVRQLARVPGRRRRPLRGAARRRRARLRVHAHADRLGRRPEGPGGRGRRSGSARSARPATRTGRTCTSRSGPTAGTRARARSRSTRCPTCSPGPPQAEVGSALWSSTPPCRDALTAAVDAVLRADRARRTSPHGDGDPVARRRARPPATRTPCALIGPFRSADVAEAVEATAPAAAPAARARRDLGRRDARRRAAAATTSTPATTARSSGSWRATPSSRSGSRRRSEWPASART